MTGRLIFWASVGLCALIGAFAPEVILIALAALGLFALAVAIWVWRGFRAAGKRGM